MPKTERTLRPAGLSGYLLALVATAAAGGLVGGLAAWLTDIGVGGVFASAVCAAIGLGLIFIICIAWWNRVDEAAREAHKWAWWWGGTAGTAIGGIFLVVAVVGARDETSTVLSTASAADLIYAGGLGIMLFQILGYGIAWAAWWLQRR